MRKNLSFSRKPLSACLVGLSLSLPCVAESSNPPDLFSLPLEQLLQVKVSVASLFEESDLDVASSVAVVQAEEWQTFGAKRLGDALESVPSVMTYTTWGGSEAIAIRGYGTELSVRGIANTLDGIPLNTFTYATSFYDKPNLSLSLLDRVEMIRGPGSTLYGSDAFHGVLSYQSLSSDINETRLAASGSNDSYSDASLFVSRNLGGININVGLDSQRQGDQEIGYQYTNPDDGSQGYSERANEYENRSGFVSIKAGDEDSGRLRFKLHANDYKSKDFSGIGTQFFVNVPLISTFQSASLPEDRDHSDQESNFIATQLQYERRLNASHELNAQIYWWNSNQEWSFDNSRYPDQLVIPSIPATLPCAQSPASPNSLYCPHTLFQNADETRHGAKLALKSDLDDFNTKLVTGIGWDTLDVQDSQFRRIALDGTVYIDDSNPFVGKHRDIGYGFFQANTEVVEDAFNLAYGLRYDHYSDIGVHFSPRLGFIFTLSPNYTSKLLYGHAFRAPTTIERHGSVGATIANLDIEAETTDTIEWVNIFHGEDYKHEVTVFGNKWKDGIVLTPVAGSSTENQYVNTGDNSSFGLELASQRKLGNWAFDSALSYVRSKNKLLDEDYVAFPQWLVTLQAAYTFPKQNIELAVKQRVMRSFATGDVTKLRNSDVLIVPPDAPNYYRTDLALAKRMQSKSLDKPLELSLQVRNLFDRRNITPSIYNAENGIADSGRELLLSLRLGL